MAEYSEWITALQCVLCVCSAGMVCAFVTNQLLHDQTSSSTDDDNADGGTAADSGLVASLVDALYAIDDYQQSTARVI